MWILIAFVILFAIYFSITIVSCTYIHPLINLPAIKYALVLGAGLEKTGKPTDILTDRVLASTQLIWSNRAKILIMSGSSTLIKYNEPVAMRSLAIQNGVRNNLIEIDAHGFSTLDSLINFIKTHKERELIIVSQRFHLPRAIWLANLMGLNCYGYIADFYKFPIFKKLFWYFREIIAVPFNLGKFLVFYLINTNKG